MNSKSKIWVTTGAALLIAVSGMLWWLYRDSCVIGAGQCSETAICAKGVRMPYSQGYCVKAYQASRHIYSLPIDQAAGVICTQSGQNPNGSHAYFNTLWALDLSSPPAAQPARILAARAGTVIETNNSCEDPGNSLHSDDCGEGFGNYVIVDHGDNTVAFYAHLSKLAISETDVLAEGDFIGIEGNTGRSGHRHLHFSIHHKTSQELTCGMGWPSIPYLLRYVVNGEPRVTFVTDIVCLHNDFSQAHWLRAPREIAPK